ncbi:MAG: CHRD domain-containing protein [Chloroflexota bacterium]
MKRFLFSTALVLTFFAVDAQDTLRGLVFSAILDTTQQDSLSQPTSARGVAGFLLLNDSLKFDITVNGLTGDIMEAGIHSESDSVLMSLDDYIDGNSIRGALTNMSLGDSLVMQLLNGTAFMVIHTEANPGGEVRGRIRLETDINYGGALNTEQAGIPDTLSGMPSGLSTFNLSMDSTMLEVNVLVTDLTSPITNAHLHYGAPGQNGPPVIPLMPYRNGNMFHGVVNLDSIPNRMAFLDSLNMGHVYVNVHTVNYPQGEVRGQLGRHDALAFDSWMNTAQSTDTLDPATPDSAMGLTHMYINQAMDSLWVHVLVDSLSGPIIGSHFHLGAVGDPGPVIVPLTDTVVGNMIMVTITAQDTTFTDDTQFATFLSQVLEGNVFINVHTALNPGGEIRGQMRGVAHAGTVFQLCTRQEPGDINGDDKGNGSGFVSMDRNRTNLHYGIAVVNLSSPLTGAHFHQAPIGVNGPVIFTLPTDSVVNGYWNDSTFTNEIAALFENGNVYANFHTTLNPDGEVRGQVMWGDLCSAPLAVNEGIMNDYNISLYPNPVQSTLMLEFQLEKAANIEVRVFDLIGKEISSVFFGNKVAGSYRESLNASQLQNGLYIYSLYINGTAVSKSKVLVNR